MLFAQQDLTIIGATITGGDVIGTPGADGSNPGDAGTNGGQAEGGGILASHALTLTDVAVTGNRVQGGDGGNGTGGMAGAGGNGGAGGTAFGGALALSGAATLTRVAITDNIAQAGKAGNGGDGGTNGAGGNGGDGGFASSGGVDPSALGLSVTDSLFANNRAIATPGGSGGAGGTNSAPPGAGGLGEGSEGGAVTSENTVNFTNVTFTGNNAYGGDGGRGGNARGTAPTAGGSGGFAADGSGGAVSLLNGRAGHFASVTFAGNTATTGTGGAGGAGSNGGPAGSTGPDARGRGGDLFVYSATATARDTIFATGHADAGGENCEVQNGVNSAAITSLGHNLDDRDQCLTTKSVGDLSDTPARLGALTNNGGPMQTMALLAGSKAIHGGASQCVDALGQPLGHDQRGLPRHSPCDIGAFEGQLPRVLAQAKIAGTPVPGHPLTCVSASIGGDRPTTSAVLWLRAGKAIAGARFATYLVKARDAGHTLACRQTVANAFGSVVSTAKPVKAVAARLTALKLSPATARSGHKLTISFTLNAASRVAFSLARLHPTRRINGAPRAVTARQGLSSLTWTPHSLVPGRYRLSATTAGGKPVTVGFKITR